MIDRCIIYFSIMSVVGYIYECLAMTFWEGKWDNRGFLFGPSIPIYGAGALFGTILFRYFLTDYTPEKVFLIGMGASAVLEYTVHYALEKIFHAYWWDYSKAPLNLNGRICLPAAMGFGLAALVIVYAINPVLLPIIDGMNETLVQLLAIALTIVFTADLTVTVTVLSGFEKRIIAMDDFINDHMDLLVGNVLDESKGLDKKFYGVVDKVDEKKKKLIDDRIDRMVTSMNGMYHGIIYRIKGYRGKNARRLDVILKAVKDKIRKRDKRDE